MKYETLTHEEVELIMKGKKLKRPSSSPPSSFKSSSSNNGQSKSGTKINIGDTGEPHFLSVKK